MQPRFAFMGGLAAAAFVAAACGSPSTGSASPTPSVAPIASSPSPVAASPSPAVPSGTTLAVASSRFGSILVDGSGRTVYLFLADSGTASTCYSSCAQYWPPVLTSGAPQAGTGATASLLGTTQRTDGTTEVTYAGHPLYYFVTDKKPGDTTGQGINGFGGPWYVISPSGMQIH